MRNTKVLSRFLAVPGLVVASFAVALPVHAQGVEPTITITSPSQNASLPSGIVVVEFAIQNFTIGDQGEPHLHFYVDSDNTTYHFYNGATQEVLYNGLHTHFVHWASPTSIQMNGVGTGDHQVRFVLADASHAELPDATATTTLNFSVTPPPAGEFALEQVLGGLEFPVAMAYAPDGRLFYNELASGQIRIVDPGFQLRLQPFYTITNLLTGGERGLLGIALDPDFASNHFVYVYHTAANPQRNRVVRLTDLESVGTDETVILDSLPASANHNAGNLHFGPDGKLYVTIGDAENPTGSQQVSYLGGKILRINKDGTIPSDNPFSNSPVWALGLRNSFDFTFHPHTGDLWATENGPDVDDEVNRILKGGNYGWPTVTGIANTPPFLDPLVDFTPPIAPTGIVAVGEDSAYPTAYYNNLLFADFNNGVIHRIVLSGPGLTELGSISTGFTGGEGGLLDLVQGPDGFIYVSGQSAIYRLALTSSGDTTPPTVTMTSPDPDSTVSGTVTVSADASDNDEIAGVQFKLNGEDLGAEEQFAPYSISWDTTTVSDGTYTLTAVARDAAGNETTASAVSVNVSNGQALTFTPVADAFVRSTSPDANYGSNTELRVRRGNSSNPTTLRSYLTFSVSGLNGSVTAATLRLFVTDGSSNRGNVRSASSAWSESTITWNSAPAPGTLLASGGSAPLETWIEITLPAAMFAAGNGTYSLAIVGGNSDRVVYSSREGPNPPELVLVAAP